MCVVLIVLGLSASPRAHGPSPAPSAASEFDADPAAFVPSGLPYDAPAFSLTDLGGKVVSNESLKGQVALLDF